MSRKRLVVLATAVLVGILVAGSAFLVQQEFFGPKRIAAVFTAVRGIYRGDEVRVSGVKVGVITDVQATGTQATVTMDVDHGVTIPANAKAVIVAQNVISARYLQLTPAYETGPAMADGAVIPLNRTAVPVEWDEVKSQLARLAIDLGPRGNLSSSSAGRFIDSAANAMSGNGDKLRETLAQLSAVGRVLADGSGNIVDIISNLQVFVTALRDSKVQIVQFQSRLATLTSVLDGSRSDLDAALTNLSQAVGEVQRFIAGTRDKTSEQIQRLADVTQNLVDHRGDLEQVLHVAPNAAVNAYNMYDPNTGTLSGTPVLNNFSTPLQFVCAAVGAVENATAAETGKLCAQYLGPALNLVGLNNLPIPINPFIGKAPSPGNIIYTDPALAPDGAGIASGPETPPAVSAYTGQGDVPPPPGYLPPPPPPAGMTDTTPQGPTTIENLLLPPAQQIGPANGPPNPPPPGNSLNGVPLPAEAPPPPPGGTP
jgi:virulence factor Mce-like protein